MSIIKQIKNKIESLKNIQNIMKAMELTSSYKVKKMSHSMRNAIIYYKKVKSLVTSLKKSHSYLDREKKSKNLLVVICPEKGLCGSKLRSVFSLLEGKMNNGNKMDDCKLIVLGNKGIEHLRKTKFNKLNLLYSSRLNMKEFQVLSTKISKILVELFLGKEGINISLIYNKFVNPVHHIAIFRQLFTININDDKYQNKRKRDLVCEPNLKSMYEMAIIYYFKSAIYKALVSNKMSEEAARAIAAKCAYENSNNIIHDLECLYNKVRQSSITEEISEILNGAAVLKD